MLASHRTWTEFLRQSADPIWWAKKAIDYQRKTEDATSPDAGRAQQLAECIWLISNRKLANREAIKLLVAKRFLGREPSRARALFTARGYEEYLRPADMNFDQPRTRAELVRFLLRRRFTYYPEWIREKASQKREVDMDSLPESQIVRMVLQFMRLDPDDGAGNDASREIDPGDSTPEAEPAAGVLQEEPNALSYVKQHLGRTRRVPLPDEFVEWAVEQSVAFFEAQAAPAPATGGAPHRAPAALPDARIERLRRRAERRNPEAQYRLAKALLCGEGVRQNLRRGLFWVALARRSGHAGAELLFVKFRRTITGTGLERLLADAEAAADQYETFSDVKVPRGGALIADPWNRQSSANGTSEEANSR